MFSVKNVLTRFDNSLGVFLVSESANKTSGVFKCVRIYVNKAW